MINIIIIAVLVVILGGAAAYVIHAKRRGVKCIGCPHGKSCNGSCSSCSGCNTGE
ncbi:MAG: FeoB-associated Cys-rich membrane protein [Ruminococcaceae bacterium]|nr:FeoB-associated Cys-rich membrane protein [Oscillospiraceae bacterium]